MPTQADALAEQGFRSSFFGFDKSDVLAYMSALAEESRQREEEFRRQTEEQHAQAEKLQGEQAAARLCVEKLQNELQQTRQLLEAAEQRARQAEEKLAAAEKAAAEKDERAKAGQQAAVELRFRCKELEDKLAAQAAAPRPTDDDAQAQARLQARKILADARLYAENAEQRLKQQAEEQKARMAEHARGVAAGVLLLRERLARVDEKIGAATLDMENATAAIYQALDAADADLDALGARLDGFDPDDPVPPTAAVPALDTGAVFGTPAAPRPRVTAQAVPPRRPRAPRAAARTTGRRLRRSPHVVSQDLADALTRFEEP